MQKHIRAKTYSDHGTQVVPFDIDKSLSQDWDISSDVESSSIVDQVKQVAESALLQTGFVYEETSGMYYDYNTGYYYDTVRIYTRLLLYLIDIVILYGMCSITESKKMKTTNLYRVT